MTPDETWTLLYDKGINGALETFSTEQKNLYYYIDFTYYVENGGASGFLYNKSPVNTESNEYKPYIESFRFFNFNDLADKIEEYNNQFLKALESYQKDGTRKMEIVLSEYGLQNLEDEIEPFIEDVMNSNESVLNWIAQNEKIIMIGII